PDVLLPRHREGLDSAQRRADYPEEEDHQRRRTLEDRRSLPGGGVGTPPSLSATPRTSWGRGSTFGFAFFSRVPFHCLFLGAFFAACLAFLAAFSLGPTFLATSQLSSPPAWQLPREPWPPRLVVDIGPKV